MRSHPDTVPRNPTQTFQNYLFVYLCLCKPLYHVHALCPQWLEEGIRYPGNGVTDSCEPPHGAGNQTLAPLPPNSVLPKSLT